MKKKDIEQLFTEFECEGIDETLFEHSSWEHIKDKEFQEKYKKAYEARKDLFDYLRIEAERFMIETDIVLM